MADAGVPYPVELSEFVISLRGFCHRRRCCCREVHTASLLSRSSFHAGGFTSVLRMLCGLPASVAVTGNDFQALSRASKEKSKEQRTSSGTASSSQKRPASSAPAGSSWHTATAGMYTAEGLAALRNSQAFTPKPSSGASERRRRVDRTRGEGTAGGVSDAGDAGGTGVGSAEGEQRVFAGDEAEIVHEAGEKGALSEEVSDSRWFRLRRGGGGGASLGCR